MNNDVINIQSLLPENEDPVFGGATHRRMLNLLSTEEFAAAVEVKPTTVLTWRQMGTGPQWTRLGKRIFYRVKDIEKWMELNLMRPEK